MSMTIWKFQLETTGEQVVRMPDGAEVLCVQTQGGTPCLWALVDPTKELSCRRFRMFATGQPDIDPGEYIGTFLTLGGTLVFHVFEVAA
jgi:hypothetical protein